MKEVITIGYGGHGFVAIDILLEAGFKIAGYLDKDEKKYNPYNLKYLGSEDIFILKEKNLSYFSAFIAIGDSNIREKVFLLLQSKRILIINAIHPKSTVAKNIIIGQGVFIAANAVINPLCTIGNGVICNTSSSIDHECSVNNFTHICPGTVLCGNVTVGKNSFIGANSVIKPGITIGDNVIVGAGSTVIKDITEPGTYAGSPLKRLKGRIVQDTEGKS